ncbi:MAG: ABC transporter substrate-binding protein [Methylovirgula sp.]
MPARFSLSRRTLVGGLATAPLLSLTRGAAAKPMADLTIYAAPTTASILLARLVDSGALGSALPGASFQLWHDPDELRAAVVSKRALLFTTPTPVPANLFNRGLPVKLLAVLGTGHLTIVTSDPKIKSLAGLAGKPVLGFFRNDMPDLVFRAAAKMEGLDPDKDFKLSYVGMPMEAAQMLAAGRVETAILSEPPATGAIMMAARQGRKLYRAINLQDIWIKHTGHAIPMIGLGVHEKLLAETPEILPLLRKGLPQAKDWVLANPQAAGELAEKVMGLHAPIVAASIAHAAIEVKSAKAAQPELEAFYKTLIALSPKALDGHLPNASFYLDL